MDNRSVKHWEKVYQRNEIKHLGWYEEDPKESLLLIDKCNLNKHDRILNIGAGATTLIDELILRGYENIIATDISTTALDKLKQRLASNSVKVEWIVSNLQEPIELFELEKVNLWHDRAVLHFLTEESDQNTYFHLLKRLVKKDGYVILAEFNLEGATQCSGLDVFRYSTEIFQNKLGKEFKLIENFNYTYTQPSGNTREFVYSLFKRECK